MDLCRDHGDQLVLGDGQWFVIAVFLGDPGVQNTVEGEAGQGLAGDDGVPQEVAAGFFVVDDRGKLKVGLLEGQVGDFGDFVGAVKYDGADALLLQLLQGGFEPGLGHCVEIKGMPNECVGQAGFFQHSFWSDQIPYPVLGIGADFKVAFLHQLLEVEIDQAQ